MVGRQIWKYSAISNSRVRYLITIACTFNHKCAHKNVLQLSKRKDLKTEQRDKLNQLQDFKKHFLAFPDWSSQKRESYKTITRRRNREMFLSLYIFYEKLAQTTKSILIDAIIGSVSRGKIVVAKINSYLTTQLAQKGNRNSFPFLQVYIIIWKWRMLLTLKS